VFTSRSDEMPIVGYWKVAGRQAGCADLGFNEPTIASLLGGVTSR
jgi:hypothetical protein